MEKKDYIIKVLKVEEERFSKTIDQGMEILNSIMDKISADQINQAVFSGEDAFRLYDTFGFPIDLTKEILAERGLPIDEEGFFRLMGEQKKRARDARKDVSGWDTDEMLDVEGKAEFVGYEKICSQGKILAILDEDGNPVDSLTEGMKATVVLDSTPFYAESGGQVGDSGVIVRGKSIFRVKDCKKSPTGQFLHLGVMKSGLMNVGDTIDSIVDEERRIAIALDIPAALPNVALDAEQMEQVFFNLLKNALEAMKDGGTVAIALDADDQDVSVTFRDTGLGMSAEQLAHLFEPYRTTKEKGTGLGLMISKRIVTEHGGSISAESAPGNGTAFTVTLPRLERRIRALK